MVSQPVPGGHAVRTAREQFLAGAALRTGVRPAIRDSWRRCHHLNVEPETPTPRYQEVFDQDSVLVRAARPALDSLATELANEPVCILLTDPKGVVLARRGGDDSLWRQLDAVNLAPGFSYAESAMGTNGIGTALELRAPVLVHGHEHYAGALGVFACAGVPITHPVNGSLLGLLDITAFAQVSNHLLMAIAKMAARRIQQQVLDSASLLEQALLSDYYTICRQVGGPVMALGDSLFMLNDRAQARFDPADQAALIAQTGELRGRTTAETRLADLPSGLVARLSYQPSFVDQALAGGIIRVEEQVADSATKPRPVVALPEIPGSSKTWRRVCADVLQAARRRTWTVLEGEEGSGKLSIVEAVHRRVTPTDRMAVIDAAGDVDPAELVERVEAELDEASTVVFRHGHLLPPEAVTELTTLLQPVRDGGGSDQPWIVLMVGADRENEKMSLELVPFFERTIVVPPLRHHLEDIPEIARDMLDRLGAGDLQLHGSVHHQLALLPWKGNLSELWSVLRKVIRRRRSGEATVDDLPAECRATTRRHLTRMERLERDAIVEALDVHGGDKTAAAAALGMSRATIYRKIRHFGIIG